MKGAVTAGLVFTLAAAGALVTYQAIKRERDYRALLAQGDAALREQETFGAIEAYSGAVALRPDSMLAHLRRGETYLRRGELDAAARDFQTAAVLDPTATRPLDELGDVKYLQKRYRRAAEIYEDDLRLDDRAALVSFKRALALYRDRNLDAALTAVETALRLNDGLAEAYYLRGLCLSERRRPSQAARAFEKAIALAPALIAAREELADLYSAVGRHEDEIEQLQVLAALDREHVERQVAIGLAHARWSADQRESEAVRTAHADLAVAAFSSALKRAPDNAAIEGHLGRIWLEIAQARDDPSAVIRAVEALERVATTSDAPSAILTSYGRALLEGGRVDLAEPPLRQATSRYPLEPSALLLYASVAELQNHPDAARQALIKYCVLIDDDAQFVSRATRIAALSFRLNDPATARTWLQRALAISPADPLLLASLAEAQLKLGDLTAAIATVARGLDKNPEHPALLALDRRLH